MATLALGMAGTATTAATAGLFGSAGAFSLLSTLGTVASAAGVASTVIGGHAQAENLRAQGRAEGTNARNREIERKRNLIDSLAMQNVRAGASGVTSGTGSSAQAIMREDISRKELDTATDVSRTTSRKAQLQRNISTVKTTSLLSAASEVGGKVSRTLKRGAVKKK